VTDKKSVAKIDAEISELNSRRLILESVSDISKVNDFLIAVCEDPKKLEAFRKDPASAVKAAGLPNDLGEVIASGDRYLVRKVASGGVVAEGETVIVIVIVIVVVA